MAKLVNPFHSTYAKKMYAGSVIYQSSINRQNAYAHKFLPKKKRSTKQKENDIIFKDAVNHWKLLTYMEQLQWQTVNVDENRSGFDKQFWKNTKGYWQFIRQYITLSHANLNPWKTPTVKW